MTGGNKTELLCVSGKNNIFVFTGKPKKTELIY